MKLSMITTLVLFCILVVGCQEEQKDKFADERLMNSKLINTYSDIAIQNAIITEHTMYPYHFIKNATELNELGQRDLAVLIRHLAKYGGYLNIRRQDASEDLYKGRVDVVRESLQEAGVDMERINILDGMPGGSGMPSEKVLVILAQTTRSAGSRTSMTNTLGVR